MKTYKFKINGKDYTVDINSIEGNLADVDVNGTSYKVELENTISAPAAPKAAPATSATTKAQEASAPAPAAESKPKPSGAGKQVNSPLPGVIIEVSVKEGQAVKTGEKIAVLEAMKMENEISASHDGNYEIGRASCRERV